MPDERKQVVGRQQHAVGAVAAEGVCALSRGRLNEAQEGGAVPLHCTHGRPICCPPHTVSG